MKAATSAATAALLLLLLLELHAAAVAATSSHTSLYGRQPRTNRRLLQPVAGGTPSGLSPAFQGTAGPPLTQPSSTDRAGSPATDSTGPAGTYGDLAASNAQPPTAGPAQSCSNAQSPRQPAVGSEWTASLSGSNNIKPDVTGVPALLSNPASGNYTLTVDEQGQKASWTLQLCNVQQYISSHLHVGIANANYPPPLVPLEPFAKPDDPFEPTNSLPQLCPPRSIDGCTYSTQGSFTATDISPLPGRQGDPEVPAVTSWADFLSALRSGNIYVNVRSVQYPDGLIRGKLAPASSAQSTQGIGGATTGDAQQAAGAGYTGNGGSGSSDQGNASGGNAGGGGGNGGFGGSGPPGVSPGVFGGSAPNFGAAYASASSGPSGTTTEQGTYTRGNANANANANTNGGG